jgi:hypothetical protein
MCVRSTTYPRELGNRQVMEYFGASFERLKALPLG